MRKGQSGKRSPNIGSPIGMPSIVQFLTGSRRSLSLDA
jgi:hypothetical protein